MNQGPNDDPSGADPDDASVQEEATEGADASRREELAKQLSRVVCICKGIPLGRVLKALEGSETVADVNRKCGSGSGGCGGERCGPRIKTLLRKKKEAQGRK